MHPKYPVYIVSKGRYKQQLTSRALHRMGVPHFIIIEEQEYDLYQINSSESATLLVLDKAYQREYETCDDLGDSKSKGPGPARNFAWVHSLADGHAWHWVMDDNINGFYRVNYNRKTPAHTGTILRCMEDFAERYENMAIVGPNYEFFVPRREKRKPLIFNHRIYSCLLIRNDIPYRWRARYNEDTDLSLRVLKDGWCTAQFNAFLQKKKWTQQMKGGNTDEFYAKEGTLPKSQMLVALHPDVARLTWKFGRWHHEVDYSPFRHNRLRRKPGCEALQDVDEYGMKYQVLRDGQWIDADITKSAS